MAQQARRKRRSRKRRRSLGSPGSDTSAEAKPYSRSEAKNEAVRASLVPLRQGERPPAVTIGAVVALLSALANVAYALGIGVDDPDQPAIGPLGFSVILLVMAWGMWRARYWAVLGFQALLALTLISLSLFVFIQATALEAALVVGAAILPLGVLFWFMVKAMARIQMPERR